MKLTATQRDLLIQMRDRDERGEYDEAELVCAIPGGWFLGSDRVAGTVAFSLLRSCLIKAVSGAGMGEASMERYVINEEGRKALADPAYVPVVQRVNRGDGVP